MVTKLFLFVSFVAVIVGCPETKTDNYCEMMEMLRVMQQEVQQVKDDNEFLRKENIVLKENMAHLQMEHAELREKVGILEAQYSADVDTLFLATISTETMAVSDDEPIPWDSALINPGGHFSTVTGGYTAPYNGYYQFSVTKRSNDNHAHFWLLVDEDRYLFNHDYDVNDGAPSSSTTINIQLTAGQLVRVENDISTLVYGTDPDGYIWSWFTGYLLYAL